MKKKDWKVYVHTNKTNGKTYVGITKTDVKGRWSNGYGYRTQRFYRAIEKYGWDGFRHEIVAENLTEDEAKTLERNLIIILKSRFNEHGYNVSEGGDTSGNSAKEIWQFDCYGNLMNTYDSAKDAAKFNKLKSYSIAGCARGDYHSAGGYIWKYACDFNNIEDAQECIKNDSHSYYLYPVYQFDYNGTFLQGFNNATEAGIITQSESINIVKCCLGEMIHTNGFCWAFQKDVPDVNHYMPRKKLTNQTKHLDEVVQLDLEGNLVAVYRSATDAGKKLGIGGGNICQCCNHYKKSYMGFQWMKKKEYDSLSEKPQCSCHSNGGIKVCQYSKEGSLLNTFPSISSAARSINIDSEKLRLIIRGVYVNTTDFDWLIKPKIIMEGE